jgi:hypothetical protein
MKIELGKDNIGTYLQVDNSVYYVKDSEGNFILSLNFPYKHNRQFRYNTPREEYIHKNNWREKLDINSPIMKIIKRFPEAEHEFVEYESGDKELIVKINREINKNQKHENTSTKNQN